MTKKLAAVAFGMILAAVSVPHTASAVVRSSVLSKCALQLTLCFDAFTRAQTTLESFTLGLMTVAGSLLGPGYLIPHVGEDFSVCVGCFPREARFTGFTNFCASGGGSQI